MAPGRRPEMSGIVIGITRPDVTVIRHVIPLFARDLARFAANANSRVGEKSNLDTVLYERVSPLIRAENAFANHCAEAGVMEEWSSGVMGWE